jgi:hypothetical protein
VQDHFYQMTRGVSRKSLGLNQEKKGKEVVDLDWEASLGFKHNSLAVFTVFGFQVCEVYQKWHVSSGDSRKNITS